MPGAPITDRQPAHGGEGKEAELAKGLPLSCWDGLAEDLAPGRVQADALLEVLEQRLATLSHGDLPRWRKALEALPAVQPLCALNRAAPQLGAPADDPETLRTTLMALHPWRKGPLCLGGVPIDTEWRSDWKWARVASRLRVRGATVLDVGCGNGYFGWRLLGAGARCVVGIDPTVLFVMQWLAQRHFAGPPGPMTANYVLPLRDVDLPADVGHFDLVMSMGVLYHRRDPAGHLRILRRCLAPGGALLLETLVVPGPDNLYPTGRYARMRNVHELPTVENLARQLAAAGFRNAELLDLSQTSTQEQRSTDWMTFESLDRSLDPDNPARTIEGHPAPLRAAFLARR